MSKPLPKVPSDETFVNSIANYVRTNAARCGDSAHMYVETAGGEQYFCSELPRAPSTRSRQDGGLTLASPGVHSPTLSGTTQVDCYRPLFLPTILVGDSKLGGISATISSYESLLLRGYIIDAVLLFRDDYYRNWEYLQPYFAERGVHLSAVDAPPPLLEDSAENYTSTEKYYDTIVPQNSTDIHQDGIFSTLQHLDLCHTGRLQELESMPRRTLDSVWWPFVQHGLVSGEKDVTVIDSAYSDFFSVHKPEASGTDKELPPITSSLLKPEFDGSASWWTQTFGHAHPSLTLAAARASGRYGHVMFPQATHLPALKLAERLLQGPGAGWASRAFFSDDGSTGMEIALKMALRAFTLRQGQELDSSQKKELGILGIKGSYHGDTIGAMDACEEGVYTCEWHNAKGYWFDPPTVSIQEGKVVISLPPAIADSTTMSADAIPAGSISWAYDVSARLQTPLARTYRSYIKSALENLERRGGPKLAALVIEPILMGAGGMIFVDPLFQRVLIDVVRQESSTPSSQWSGLPVIFDEVFVGLYRIGMQSTGPLLGAYPDISVNAKVLTGGLIPLAITMASDSIFQAFLSDKKADALLHGHSYTAHPIGCEVANETLQLIDKLVSSDHWKGAQKKWETPDGTPGLVWSLWNPHFINRISWLPMVDKVMALGSVLAIQMKDDSG